CTPTLFWKIFQLPKSMVKMHPEAFQELDYKEESHFDFETFRSADIEVDNDADEVLSSPENNENTTFIDSGSLDKTPSSLLRDKDSSTLMSSKKRKRLEESSYNEVIPIQKLTKLPKALYKAISFEHNPIGQAEYFRRHVEFAVNQGKYLTKDIKFSLPASRFYDISFLQAYTDEEISYIPSKRTNTAL
ncbi:hypothetical protein HMI56_003600, partial [Coelomomyces lativittatus]